MPKFEITTQNKTTNSLHDNEVLPNIKSWTEFNKALSLLKRMSDDSKIYDSPDIRNESMSLSSEDEVKYKLLYILEKVFNYELFKSIDYENGLIFKLRGTREGEDLILTDDSKKIYLPIEVKTKSVICLENSKSLVEIYKRDETKNSKPVRCIKQLYSYMRKNENEFGLLTIYDQSWFFRLERGGLLISDTVVLEDLLTAIHGLLNSFIFKKKD